jgi:hypothetical protein
VTAPDGAQLVIPPGALGADTDISISVLTGQAPTAQGTLEWEFKPDGLVFKKPATFTFSYLPLAPNGPSTISVLQASTLTPMVDVGGEESNFTSPTVLANDEQANTVSVEMEHFTFLFAAIAVFDEAMLIVDVPPQFLKPADMVFTLTDGVPTFGGLRDATWRPGHVGLFAYQNSRDSCAGPSVGDRVYESTPPNVQASTLYDDGTGKGFKIDPGHLYLGARRTTGAHALSDAQRASVVSFAFDQIGKPYFPIGAGYVADGSFSCVGLVEAAYDAVGSEANPVPRLLIPVPWEDYIRSSPVEDVEMTVGETLDITVSAAIVEPSSPYLGLTLLGSYTDVTPSCSGSICSTYAITANTEPASATFTAGKGGHFKFHFQATDADAGNTYSEHFTMNADPHATGPLGGDHSLGSKLRGLVLNVHVLPACMDAGAPDAGTDAEAGASCSPPQGACMGDSDCCPQAPPPGTLGTWGLSCTNGTCCEPHNTYCLSDSQCCAGPCWIPPGNNQGRCVVGYQGACPMGNECYDNICTMGLCCHPNGESCFGGQIQCCAGTTCIAGYCAQ